MAGVLFTAVPPSIVERAPIQWSVQPWRAPDAAVRVAERAEAVLVDGAVAGDAFPVAAALDARERRLDARQRLALVFADPAEHDDRRGGRGDVLPVWFAHGE